MPAVHFSETETDIIERAAAPIVGEQREAFIEAVLAALTTYAIVGPGLTHRVCRDLQKSF